MTAGLADMRVPTLRAATTRVTTAPPAPARQAPREADSEVVVLVEPERFVTIAMFSSISGYSQKAIRNKIGAGVWIDRREWIKTPDGRIFIDRKGVAEWQIRGV